MTHGTEFRDVLVWVNGTDREGKLTFVGGRLIGVFVRLNDNDGEAGKWFLEAGFGPASTIPSPTFDSLEEAAGWIEQQASLSGRELT